MRGMQRGFTLLEVVIAVAILGILAAIGWGTIEEHLSRF
jgi:prepilin-type N-terminal cleavage/methylation domain-containing protein